MYTYSEIRGTDKKLEPWWTEIVLKHFVYRAVWIFANYTKFTPNHITILSFSIGVLSAYIILQGGWTNLIIGALLFELSYIIDRIDGRIARLKGLQSKFGAYIDFITDITKYFLITLSLVYSQYLITGNISYFIYGFIFIFLEFIAVTHTYVIPDNKSQRVSDTYNTLHNKFPLIFNIKKSIDPNNRLAFSPSAVEAETAVFFVAPIMNQVGAGFIIGSIILIIYILLSVIFYFFMKR